MIGRGDWEQEWYGQHCEHYQLDYMKKLGTNFFQQKVKFVGKE